MLAGTMTWAFSLALHMVSFEIFVKAMPPSLLELKVLPSFCFAFKIPDDVAASIICISRQSQPMTAMEMIIRVNLNFDLYFVSAQRNDNFCSVLLNLLHYQIL